MSSFPTTFSDSTIPVPRDNLGPVSLQCADKMDFQDYEVHYGLTQEYAEQIIQMALEPSIKEFCPNDYGKRFASIEATQEWLGKGRGTFLLLQRQVGAGFKLAGYGWAGAGTSSHVPGGETTFAIRIGEAGQGQGLGTPFAQLIVAGAATVYDARNMWLETWQSNGGAVHIYHKIGFEDVDQKSDHRPTSDGGEVKDTRLYMSLSNDLLNS